MEKVFLEISQNVQENTCARVSFLKKLVKTPLVAAFAYSIFNSCYSNNKVTCEKFDVLLYATFGRPDKSSINMAAVE